MKKNVLIVLITVVLFIFTSRIYSLLTSEAKANPNNYWNPLNAPIFYGASKVTIPLNFEYSPLDPRFRVFSTDFEDGDLTDKLTYESNVDSTNYGTYQVNYSVTDSHGNKNIFTQTVEVIDTNKINVERILYTLPDVSNMSKAGFYRANYADRQILGVYLKSGESIKARLVDSDLNVTIQYFANDSEKEGTNTVLSSSEWTNIINTKSYSSVPLVNTNVLTTPTINKTLKIELEYDLTIHKLNYYHYKDNEDSFKSSWNNTQDDYAVIDSERLLVVVPYTDINYMTNYYSAGFQTLDGFFDYYKKVIEFYDENIGLSLNPEKLTDQNVRCKYLVKANYHGAGAAYYSVNHVATNSEYVRAFFERNWGGLHEIAHGYQGSLSGDDLALGEVSNNILGHYVQVNKDIYPDNADWLGLLPNIEDEHNQNRISGGSYSDTSLKGKLYMIINLFDYLEGAKTYAKMFSWYREQVSKGRTFKSQDAYVEALAEIYNINIAPYLESWGLTIDSKLKDKLYDKDLKTLNIIKDIAKDETSNVLSTLNLNKKYGLIDNQSLSNTNINGSLTINLDIDDVSLLSGKKIYLKDNGTIYKTITINSKTIVIDNISIGTYKLLMPVLDEYTSDLVYVSIKSNSNTSIDYKYTKAKEIEYDNYMGIRILGTIFDTTGIEIKFSDNYKKANIKMSGANMNNVDTYLKVFDENNNEIVFEKADGLYFDYSKAAYDIDVDVGYRVELKHPNQTRIRVYSYLANSYVDSYQATTTVFSYYVIENGIRPETVTEEEAFNTSYEILKPSLINTIETYKANASSYEINNKYINSKGKKAVIDAYNKLSDTDKAPYTDFVLNVIKGGSPVISVIGSTSYQIDDNIDLYKIISASDNEDGELEINKNTVKVISNINPYKAGTYKVTYTVIDSDLNETKLDIYITLTGNDKVEEGINVYIDNNYVAKNNYKVKDDKVIIDQEYLNTLDDDKHYVTVKEDEDIIKETIIDKVDMSNIVVSKEDDTEKDIDYKLIYYIIGALSFIVLMIGLIIKKHQNSNEIREY